MAAAWASFYTFGLVAYLKGFALWWAAWIIGVVLCAAVLRAIIEAGTIGAILLHPAWSMPVRRSLESVALAAALSRRSDVAADSSAGALTP